MEEKSVKVSTRTTTWQPPNPSSKDPVARGSIKGDREIQVAPLGCIPGSKDHVEPGPHDPVLNYPSPPAPYAYQSSIPSFAMFSSLTLTTYLH